MAHPSFARRMGFDQSAPIVDDFPDEARIALSYLLHGLLRSGRIGDADALLTEFCWVGAIEKPGVTYLRSPNELLALLRGLSWDRVFGLCERLYRRLLQPAGHFAGDPRDSDWVETEDATASRMYYAESLNELLTDRNIAYEFRDGRFHRRGRPQTQHNIERVGTVLTQPRLQPVLKHYTKALQCFGLRPSPDYENTVKEAACALEACVEVVTTTEKVSQDFELAMKQLQGTGPHQIPPAIAQSMVKLHAFRGAARGAGHAALKGSEIAPADAELVLSLTAAYITYLADRFPLVEEEIPF